MSTVCPNCGTKFDYQAQFCDKCGVNIEKERLLSEQKKQSVFPSSNVLNNKLQGYVQIVSVLEIAIGLMAFFMALLMALISPFMKEIILSSNNDNVTYSNSMTQFITSILLVMALILFIIS